MPSSRISLLAVLAAGCATTGAPLSEPHSFQDVRKIVLVRMVDDPAAMRGKDPLDALQETLLERGYDARLVEIGRGRKAPPEVETLYLQVDGRIAAGSAPDRPGNRTVRVSAADASAALAALGADAMATYHRFTGLPTFLPPMRTDPLDPFARPGALYPPPADAVPYQPLGALSLVDREGDLTWFDWGAPAAADPDVPANAAEAVDAILRALSGQSAEGA